MILDFWSRFVVGWAMSARLTRELTLDALDMAPFRRRPLHGRLHHYDRGSQYASGNHQRVLAAAGLVCSMSRRGNCWDNAVAESFFATVKVEQVHAATWETRAAARSEIFEYIEVFYKGSAAIRRSGIFALGPSSGSGRNDDRQLNPGVHQTGAKPYPLTSGLSRSQHSLFYRNFRMHHSSHGPSMIA